MTSAAPVSAGDPGRAYEAGLDAAHRRNEGVFYTPPDVARGLIAIALDGSVGSRRPESSPLVVCDPACGAGSFLLAAADHLEAAGHQPGPIVEELLWGADLDADAVAVARTQLRAWAAARGVVAEPIHLVVADTLVAGREAWADAPAAGFDLVVGNPPFQSQLATGTARRPGRAAAVRARLGPVAAPYTDSAALFLVVACRMAAPGGRVAMIVPESVLSARDAGPARAAVLADAELVGIWWARDPVFAAGVQVCSPVLALPGGQQGAVRRWQGRNFATAGSVALDASGAADGHPWSPLLASLRGTPDVPLATGDREQTVASMATATAGFRDQYYGLVPHVVELDDAAPTGAAGPVRLLTAGLIDPLHERWGAATTRFGGRGWVAPVVDLDGLRNADPRLGAWADQRLVPKLVVATQTRALELIVDGDGRRWPSVPTIAVVPRSGDPDELWRLAAALLAPPVAAWAHTRFGGSALSGDALKLSASQVLDAPLPTDAGAWRDGAAAARRAHAAAESGDRAAWAAAVDDLGVAMTSAHRAGDDVLDWWRRRLPAWR